jgi:transposase-like protein
MVDRKQLGHAIAQTFRAVRRVTAIRYRVRSQSCNGKYEVNQTNLGWVCNCADHKFRGVRYKHIYAVEFSYAIRETVRQEIIIQQITTKSCPHCRSPNLVKHGLRHNKYGDIQRYSCKDCHKRFTINIGFEKMHASPQVITSAMQLYFSGESFRNIKNFFRSKELISVMLLYTSG